MIYEKLQKIQQQLKAPKDQYNSFGKYNYRNLEGILEALKPLLAEHKCLLTISDEIVQVGDRIYVKATASLQDGELQLVVEAYAREAQEKKGMDEAQITGAASSYARKYALNGLFLIDDVKDPDTMDNTKSTAYKSTTTTMPKTSNSKDDVICEKCKSKMYKSKFPDRNGNDYYYCSNRSECNHKYWPPIKDKIQQESITTYDEVPLPTDEDVPF